VGFSILRPATHVDSLQLKFRSESSRYQTLGRRNYRICRI